MSERASRQWDERKSPRQRQTFNLLLESHFSDGWLETEGHRKRQRSNTHSDASLFLPGSLSHGLMRTVIWKIPPLTKEADVSLGLQAVGKM